MYPTKDLTIVAVFTSLIIASDYALAPAFNVKLVDTFVFSSAYSVGFRIGAYIAILSEFIWGVVSPNGFGGLIIPFLVLGEIIYAFAGYSASKIWGLNEVRALSPKNLFFGAILAICAFVWDLETNLATGFLEGAHTFIQYLTIVLFGVPFAIAHELSDFVLGATLVPIVILYFRRHSNQFRNNTELVATVIPQSESTK